MQNHEVFREHGVRIGASSYGLGVFSLRALSAREVLGPIRGHFFVDGDFESDYCMALGEIGCLEPDAPFRFLNHSCRPNCSLLELESEQEDGGSIAQLWVSIDSDIDPGEQLTIDYGWPAEHAVPCLCGIAECRHWIVAADQLPLVSSAGG